MVVASVCNVAASGGYYIAMGCETIVCDELSITGSIGVVQAKLAIGELLDKVGINNAVIEMITCCKNWLLRLFTYYMCIKGL